MATTSLDEANDTVYIIALPANRNVYLKNLQMVADDLDSGATPALTLSAIATDGSTTKTLISASTIGQGGGNDDLDANLGLGDYDFGGYWIATKVGTGAATAAAGTVKFIATVFVGDITSVVGV